MFTKATMVEALLKYGQIAAIVLGAVATVYALWFTISQPKRFLLQFRLAAVALVALPALITIALLPDNAERMARSIKDAAKLSELEKLRIMLIANDEAQKQAAKELHDEEYRTTLEELRTDNRASIAEQKADRQATRDRNRAEKNLVGAWATDPSIPRRETIRFYGNGTCAAYFWGGRATQYGNYLVASPNTIFVTWAGAQQAVRYPSSLFGSNQYIEIADNGGLHASKEQN